MTIKVKDAVYAYCVTHDCHIPRSVYWGLSTTIALHKSGIGSREYYEVRGLPYKACRIKLVGEEA